MQFEILFGLTILVDIIKFILFLILLKNLIQYKNKRERPAYNLLVGFTILMFCLFLSRFFYIIFDFVLTKFNISLYPLSPNIWFWKLGSATSSIGLIHILYFLDKKIYNLKFKGIFGILPLIGAIILILFPIKNLEDFQILSFISIFFATGAIIVLIIFTDLIRKTVGSVRRMGIFIVTGLILWTIGGTFLNINIVNYFIEMIGNWIQIPIYIISAMIKIIGLILFSNGAIKLEI